MNQSFHHPYETYWTDLLKLSSEWLFKMVKFTLPQLSSDEEDNISQHKITSFPSDEENDSSNTTLKFNFKRHKQKLGTEVRSEDKYSTFFLNSNPSPPEKLGFTKILNLNDLDEESEEILPPRYDIHHLPSKPNSFSDVPHLKEKEFKSYLDDDDLQILTDMRLINHRNKNKNPSDAENNVPTLDEQLKDERLALTENEMKFAAREKRRKINSLLNTQNDAETAAEVLMDEINQVERLTGQRMIASVSKNKETSWEALNKSLSDALQSLKNSNDRNAARIKSLESQLIVLSDRQQQLVQNLVRAIK